MIGQEGAVGAVRLKTPCYTVTLPGGSTRPGEAPFMGRSLVACGIHPRALCLPLFVFPKAVSQLPE